MAFVRIINLNYFTKSQMVDPITVCAGVCIYEVMAAAFVGGAAAEAGRRVVAAASDSGSGSKNSGGKSKGADLPSVEINLSEDYGDCGGDY